ncbi:MAG: hypothetical protein Q9N62_04680 [Ghiorsea sp.]|nr:hypothetical protein [Ghiorsea sp.]
MNSILKDKNLLYYHIEWILMHPRFGFLMIGLVALSFTHEPWLAVILFTIFVFEIGARIAIMVHKTRTNPYRTSLNRKIDGLFLILDIIGVASLLITIFEIPFQAEDAALVRMLRAVYLLRTLRVFRYFDLESAMYSPTYGMFTSLIIMVSFFATDTLMWVIIIFFAVELSLRYLIMRNMNYETRKEKIMEWFFWWLDVIATIVMIPAFAIIPYGGALRMMRLVRLLRPWLVIIRNLKDVMREGQFMQEINLIVLVLAVISIAGGIFGKFLLPGFDFTQDGNITPQDDSMIARIWFSFRLFTDPGNSVAYPDNASIAIFSIVAVVIGVFIFAFFIGIGASIVSDLMTKLRNERLAVTRHMVMIGWSDIAPYIITHLRLASERSFSRLKLVLLQESEQLPDILLEEKWVTYRTGDSKYIEDLNRVNLSAARQALILVPDDKNTSEALSESFFSLLAIRKMHPDIYLSIALPGMSEPRIAEHKHMLQVGWDNQGEYDKPTVILSAADFRANAFKNILQYSDFDQVVSRLMIPERTEESAMQVCEWSAEIRHHQGETLLFTPDGQHNSNIIQAAQDLLKRGVILLAIIDDNWQIQPLYQLPTAEKTIIKAVVGIAINENALHGELHYVLHHPEVSPNKPVETFHLSLHRPATKLRLLITGWVDSLPLLLKRLMPDYQHIEVVLLDNLPENELIDEQTYLERRLNEESDAKKVSVSVQAWDFSDMEVLRDYVKTFTHIILSQPQASEQEPYTVISTILSHMISMIHTEQSQPKIYPVLSDRNQARLLQEELDRFTLPTEVHLVVPNEFYGAYVAHTSFHMYTAENDDVYQMKRVLRHVIHDLMSEDGSNDALELYTMDVHQTLPNEPEALYASLLDQGFIWIGYRLNHAFSWDDPVQNMIRTVFPREGDFHCLRQHQIIINPFGNPISRRSWEHNRDDIAELIVIGENISPDTEESST